MTQEEKIIATMTKAITSKDWFLPVDFMRMGSELFVGYEASARLSELAADYPDMIESRKKGRFLQRRICFETIAVWFPGLPEEIKRIFRMYNVTPETVPKIALYQPGLGL